VSVLITSLPDAGIATTGGCRTLLIRGPVFVEQYKVWSSFPQRPKAQGAGAIFPETSLQ
jgi:hypothetical protein